MFCDKLWLTLGALAILVYPEADVYVMSSTSPATSNETATTAATTTSPTTTPAPTPATPSGVQILSITTSSVTVRVTTSAGRYDGVKLWLNTTQGSSSESSTAAWVNTSTETQKDITVTGLSNTPGAEYTATVSTRLGSIFSNPSAQSNGKTVAPAPPTGIEIQSISTGHVTVTVTMSAGRYDGVTLRLYTGGGQSPVSSGTKNVTAETVNAGARRDFTVTGLSLTPGQQYTVTVSTKSGSESSGLSPKSVSKTVAPAPPTGVEIQSISTGHVTVTVTMSAGRYDGVTLRLYTGGGQSPVSSGTKNVTAETVNAGARRDFTVTGLSLTPGQQYTVTVSTKSGSESSGLSPKSVSKTVAPAPPTGIEIQSISTGHVTVTVTMSAGRYDGVTLRLYTGGGQSPVSSGTKNVTAETVNAGEQRNFTVTGLSLTPGQQYTVTVSTKSGSESSGLSPKSVSKTVAPAPPTRVEIQSISTGHVTVTVTMSAGRYDGVTLRLYTGGGQSPVSSGTKNVTAETVNAGARRDFTVTGLSLTPGQQYTVTVSTKSGSESSGLSPKSVSKTVAPATPTGVQIQSISTGHVTVTVTMSAGRYDGVTLRLYTGGGQSPVSSGTKDVTAETVTAGARRDFTVTGLSPSLTPGQQYNVTLSTKSGSESSGPSPKSLSKTVAPATPTGVQIQSISTGHVTVTVTMSAGRYDGVTLRLYTGGGQSPVSSGTKDVTAETVTAGARRDFTVTGLSPSLTPGQQYNVTLSTKSGSESSGPSPKSLSKTVAPSIPVSVSALSSSADRSISVTWRKGTGLVDKFYLMATGPDEWSTLKEITYQHGQNQSNVVLHPPVSGLYNLTLKAQSNNVNSSEYRLPPVELIAPPVNISVESQTSRSFELMWERTDTNVKNFRLVVSKENNSSCVREVLFNEQNTPSQTGMPCSNVSRQEFGKKQMNFTYNVTELFPYIEYRVEMYLKSEDVPEKSDPATLNVRTNPEVPSEIKNTNVTVEGAKNVRVCWSQPEPFPGPTNYTLTLMDLGQDGQQDTQLVVPGFDSQCTLFSSLEEFWPYKVKLIASTEVGDGPETETIDFRTLEAAPGKVTQVEIKQVQNNYHQLNATWKAPQLRDRNANITNFNLSYKLSETSDNETVFTLPWSSAEEVRYAQIVSVKPEQNYTFQIFALSENFTGDVVTEIYYAPAGRPPPPSGCVIDCTNPPASHSAEPESISSFRVTFNTDFFTDNTNGKITDYGLVVEAVQNTEPTASSSLAGLKASHFQEIDNWYEAKKNNFQTYYRATPLGWSYQSDVSGNRPKREATVTAFTVGADTNCSEKDATSYCNGPLNPGMEYRVKAFSCTAGGCTETKYVGGYRTKEVKDLKIIIIAVSVSCGLVIIILIIIIGVLVRRSKRQKEKDNDTDTDVAETSPNFIPLVEQTEPEEPPTSKAIDVIELNEVVEEMHQDSNLEFSHEYSWLKIVSPKLPVTAAALEANRVKNRYTDILPFDDTRVKLLPVEDDEASDYINANYIPGFHSQREYIAAQGPLKATLEDFWRMIWEQDVSIVVMLTKLQEKGQDKCFKYWPDESDGTSMYGDVVVEPVSYSNLNTYDLREFSVSMGSTKRRVKQFHFLMWPDFGVSNCEDMVNFLQDVRNHVRPNMSGPLLIHCSAGVGRTGSFIAVDQIREKIYAHSGQPDVSIDIYGLVLTMRHHRPRMVQTEAQYVFIHDAVCEVLRQKLIQEQPEDEHIYGNEGFNQEENLYENTKFEGVIYDNMPKTEL